MLQTARSPRNLALLALAVTLALIFILLGRWQLGVAQDDARVKALEEGPRQPVVALTDYLQPHSDFPKGGSLRRVSAAGSYDAAHQMLVPDRRLDGRTGLWVITPFVVDGTGARLAVVRGFVTDPSQASKPAASGKLTVVGALAPAESPSERTDYPAGQIGSVDIGKMLNVWGGDAYNAFIFGMTETPNATAATITKVPPPSPEPEGLNWRNAGYALQWWVFAAFALYVWWRTVREDQRDDIRAAALDQEPTEPKKDLHV